MAQKLDTRSEEKLVTLQYGQRKTLEIVISYTVIDWSRGAEALIVPKDELPLVPEAFTNLMFAI